MEVGDQVVLLKGFLCSAHDGLVGCYPTGGELATVEHVYAFNNSVWIRFENGGGLCTWQEYLAVPAIYSPPKPIGLPQSPHLFELMAARRIQV